MLFDRTERLFTAGQAAIETLAVPRAVHLLERAPGTDRWHGSGHPYLYLYLAIANAEMGQHGAAVSLLKRAAELDPSNFALMNPGLIHLDGGVPDAAIEYFRSAAALAPQNPVIKGYEALATRDLGSPHLVAERLPIIRDLSRAVKAEQTPLRTDAATSVSSFGRAYGAATYHRMDVEAP